MGMIPPTTNGLDCDKYLRLLEDDAGRLFSSESFEVEIASSSRRATEPNACRENLQETRPLNTVIAKSSEYLEDQLQVHKSEATEDDVFFFIKQPNSWSRFQITLEAFAKVLACCDVFLDFLNCVYSFGSKIKDSDTNFSSYSRLIQPIIKGAPGKHRFEFCYNIQYPAKHGRDLPDPWSMRQMAIYHSSDSQSKASNWIFLQLPQTLKSELLGTTFEQTSNTRDGNLTFHNVILTYATKNWRLYVNFLEESLRPLNEKACFSRVGWTYPHDYVVDFSDTQTVQNSYRKIQKAQSAIESSLDIVWGLTNHYRQLMDLGILSPNYEPLMKLEIYSVYLKNHQRSLASLVAYSQSIRSLLFKLLDHRNDGVLHKNGEALRQISLSTQLASEDTKILLEKTQEDSRIMKILTFIAMIYLPASLVAGVFSSNLLRYVNNGSEDSGDGHLVASGEIWIYPVVVLLLTGVTIGGAIGWSRRQIFRTARVNHGQP